MTQKKQNNPSVPYPSKSLLSPPHLVVHRTAPARPLPPWSRCPRRCAAGDRPIGRWSASVGRSADENRRGASHAGSQCEAVFAKTWWVAIDLKPLWSSGGFCWEKHGKLYILLQRLWVYRTIPIEQGWGLRIKLDGCCSWTGQEQSLGWARKVRSRSEGRGESRKNAKKIEDLGKPFN